MQFEIVFFGNKYEEYASLIAEKNAVIIDGYISSRNEMAFSVVVNKMTLLSENSVFKEEPKKEPQKNTQTAKEGSAIKKIYAKIPSYEEISFKRVKALAEIFEGDVPLIIYCEKTGEYKDHGLRIKPTEFVIEKLKGMLSNGAVVVK